MIEHIHFLLLFITDDRLCRQRNDGSNPIHKSHYNRNDPANIISARIKPKDGSAKTHHIYGDGTGTMHMQDKKEYSTSARQNKS